MALWVTRCARPVSLVRFPVPNYRLSRLNLHTHSILRVDSIEDVRRKVNAAKDAQLFRKQINSPDRTIGVAYAELELERRAQREWKIANGKMTQKDWDEMEREREEMIADGIDPRRGRWGEYLRKKRVEKKTGMMEFQAGTSTVSYRDRKLTLAKQAEYRRSNPTSAAKINKKNKRKAKRS